ncbi:ATP-binding protein [Sphingopyxis sp. CCNWLW253]|uniref:PAS domain-containing sensor histidine kinase n=1 Tax=unclassified Sphingopyxis TaxID=2614943 RepID=UPI003012E51C
MAIFAPDFAGRPPTGYLPLDSSTADVRPRRSLRESEKRYRNLIHNLPWALVQVDSTAMLPIFDDLRCAGVSDITSYLAANPALMFHSRNVVRVTDANRQAVELFGADGANRLIAPVDYLFAASPDTAKRVIAAHFDRRRNHSEIMKLLTFDGRLRDVQLSVTYPTPPEPLDVTLLTFEDVTERLRTEAQLRQVREDYSRATRIATLGELTSSIAHEVNQPLSAITMNAETSLRWLSRTEPDLAKVRQLVDRIADSARLASQIVQRIRTMVAPQLPDPVALDLNAVVEEALLFVRHDIEMRAISLSTALNVGLPQVRGDCVQLQQVVVNLLVNSLQALAQAGTAEGRIDLASGTADDDVFFSVRDNGAGIAEEDLGRIFDSFFTTKPDGMGIGLAVCQAIITAHGGRMVASNHPAGGAVFRFTLPAARP